MAHYHDLLDELAPPARELRSAIPDVFSGYAEMARGAMGEGALDAKTKELIALAIGCLLYTSRCV